MREATFTRDYELALVEGDVIRQSGGARFSSERLPLADLEEWLRAQQEARAQIDAVAAGIRRELILALASALTREFDVRTLVLSRDETVRFAVSDKLDDRATFERRAPDGLLVVALATREVDEGGSGSSVLEVGASVAMLGPDEAVSQVYEPGADAYLVCALRRGSAWIQPLDRDCAATLAARVVAAIRAARSQR